MNQEKKDTNLVDDECKSNDNNGTDLNDALQRAKYNESVTAKIGDAEYVLIASLDRQNGGIQWNPLSSQNDDVIIRRHLRTKQWIWPMLQDVKRTKLYQLAIQRAIDTYMENHSNDTNTVRVLDIGSGTGLLAMMVSHYFHRNHENRNKNSRDGRKRLILDIKSLEMSSPMASLARSLTTSQQNEHSIEIVETHSMEYNLNNPINGKFSICTSELLESGLLGEGLLPTMNHAWKHLLQPNAIVIPQCARVCIQLLEGPKSIASYNDINTSEKSSRYKCTNKIPIQGKVLLEQPDVRVLSKPIPSILEIDWSQPPDQSAAVTTTTSTQIPILHSGTIHGIIVWWELDLYKEYDDLTYSTTPYINKDEDFQDHWQQCLHVLPKPIQIESNDKESAENFVTIISSYDESTLSFDIVKKSDEQNPKKRRHDALFEQPENNFFLHPIQVSPERVYQYQNNEEMLSIYEKSLDLLFQKQSFPNTILDLSDGCTCTMLALGKIASAYQQSFPDDKKCINVVSLEGNIQEAKWSQSLLQQFKQKQNSSFSTNISILHMYPENVQKQHLFLNDKESKTLVLMEPFHHVLDGWPIMQALNYHYMIQSLYDRTILLPSTVNCIPHQGRIMACVVQFEQLQNAYRSNLHQSLYNPNWNHQSIEKYWNKKDVSISMWQYPHTILTNPFCLSTLSYQQHTKQNKDGSPTIDLPFIQSGTCHALVTWMEYDFLSEKGQRNILSTWNKSYKQAVRFFSKYETITTTSHYFSCKGCFVYSDHCQEIDTNEDYDIQYQIIRHPKSSGIIECSENVHHKKRMC